ncbi:MAG: PEP-CTERM sorting domain-containing protein [Burkholderiales bacterium]|nr:PEP-CTERM sorting domain-containing protein [Burkholderiales bacterium]
MNIRIFQNTFGLIGLAGALISGSANAAMTVLDDPVPAEPSSFWVDWTSATAGAAGTVTGTLGALTVTYAGEVRSAQTDGGTNYWNPATPYLNSSVPGAPPASDIITLIGGNSTTNIITFSAPMLNPVMAIVSLGQSGQPVSYLFDQPFTILSQGTGYWGGGSTSLSQSGTTLIGREGHGVIQFTGTFTTLSWTAPNAENWHGFTVGGLMAPVPEPETWTMLGLGLAGLGLMARRRKV